MFFDDVDSSFGLRVTMISHIITRVTLEKNETNRSEEQSRRRRKGSGKKGIQIVLGRIAV
jgi:hypothetical protein